MVRCQDCRRYRPANPLTVFQFRYFVRSKERSLITRLEEIRDELDVGDALTSHQPQQLQRTVTRLALMGPLPAVGVLLKTSRLLLDPSDHPNNPRILAASYLKNSAADQQIKQRVRLLPLSRLLNPLPNLVLSYDPPTWSCLV